MKRLAIDFGGARTRVCQEGDITRLTPAHVTEVSSAVAVESFTATAGDAVAMTAALSPEAIVTGLRRLLGRRAADPAVRRVLERSTLTDAADSGAHLVLTTGAGKTSAIAAVSAVLVEARDLAGAPEGSEVALVVPAWFDDSARDALQHAATGAGLETAGFIVDVVAAAAWAAHCTAHSDPFAVVDVGASGCSVGIFMQDGPDLHVLATEGSAEQGGADIDAAMVATVAPDATPATFELFRGACEGIKHELVMGGDAVREVRLPGRAKPARLDFDRMELELLLGAFTARLGDAAAAALEAAGVSSDELGAVYIAGGMGSFESVAKAIQRHLGQLPQPTSGGAGVVALGACLWSLTEHGDAEGPRVTGGTHEAAQLEPLAPAELRQRRPRLEMKKAMPRRDTSRRGGGRSDGVVGRHTPPPVSAPRTRTGVPASRRRPEVKRGRVAGAELRKRKRAGESLRQSRSEFSPESKPSSSIPGGSMPSADSGPARDSIPGDAAPNSRRSGVVRGSMPGDAPPNARRSGPPRRSGVTPGTDSSAPAEEAAGEDPRVAIRRKRRQRGR